MKSEATVTRHPSRKPYGLAAGLWLILFCILMAFHEIVAGDRVLPRVILNVTVETSMLALSAVSLGGMLRSAPHRGWSTGRTLACWGWTVALLQSALNYNCTSLLIALHEGPQPIFLATQRIESLLRVPISPMVVLLVAFQSARGARGRGWPASLMTAAIAILLLVWLWVTRPQPI
ncbi:MAG TPA: hypothetical protein VFR81_09400 [Longimicrobium sp.]|nr:hypothetical protein [Longimicrobium sp.]